MSTGTLPGRGLRAIVLLSICVAALTAGAAPLEAQSFPYLRAVLSNTKLAPLVVPEATRDDAVRDSVVEVARQQLGKPYRLGANSPDRGFDCSGLALYVMRHFGIDLPRTAAQQARQGEEIRDRRALLPGDLLTFGRGSRITHVGIYVGNGRYIHANSTRGYVTENDLPSATTGRWGQWWKGVRRLALSPDSARAGG